MAYKLKIKPKKTLTPAQRRAIIQMVRASAMKRKGKIASRKVGSLKRRRKVQPTKTKTGRKRKKK